VFAGFLLHGTGKFCAVFARVRAVDCLATGIFERFFADDSFFSGQCESDLRLSRAFGARHRIKDKKWGFTHD
jgi:hypothetical protein